MEKLLKLGLVAALAIGAAFPVLAQNAAPLGYDPPPAGATAADGVVALSADERTAVLESAARGKELPINGAPDRKIHGEMGVEVDSRGGHAIYGTTVVPIGQSGTAAFSFMNAQSGHYYRR